MNDQMHNTDKKLNALVRGMEAQLGEMLDVEAGLRDVLLEVRHDQLRDDINPALDIEAGLSDLLSHVTTTEPRSSRTQGDVAWWRGAVTEEVPSPRPADPVSAAAGKVRKVARSMEGLYRAIEEREELIVPTIWTRRREELRFAAARLNTLADHIEERQATMGEAAVSIKLAMHALQGLRKSSRTLPNADVSTAAIDQITAGVADLAPVIQRLFDRSDDNSQVLL